MLYFILCASTSNLLHTAIHPCYVLEHCTHALTCMHIVCLCSFYPRCLNRTTTALLVAAAVKLACNHIQAAGTFLTGTTTGFFSGFKECLSCRNCMSGVTLGFAAASAWHAPLRLDNAQ